MKKLLAVRDVILTMNTQYILSAGQAAEYRTEPPFLLQGSYRNMNRIAARVLPVMNEQELRTLINSSYEQDAQTLTSAAEANLLKFRELTGQLSPEQSQRWEEIKRTFNRNRMLGSAAAGEDRAAMAVRQLSAIGASMDGLQDALAKGVSAIVQSQAAAREEAKATRDEAKARAKAEAAPKQAPQAAELIARHLEEYAKGLSGIKQAVDEGVAALSKRHTRTKREEATALESAVRPIVERMGQIISALQQQSAATQAAASHQVQANIQALTGVLEEQFRMMETWLEPVAKNDAGRQEYLRELVERFQGMVDGYSRLIEVLRSRQGGNA